MHTKLEEIRESVVLAIRQSTKAFSFFYRLDSLNGAHRAVPVEVPLKTLLTRIAPVLGLLLAAAIIVIVSSADERPDRSAWTTLEITTQTFDGIEHCRGVRINNTTMLTALHCVEAGVVEVAFSDTLGSAIAQTGPRIGKVQLDVALLLFDNQTLPPGDPLETTDLGPCDQVSVYMRCPDFPIAAGESGWATDVGSDDWAVAVGGFPNGEGRLISGELLDDWILEALR